MARFLRQLRMGQEAQGPQAIVEGHHHDAVPRQGGGVEQVPRRRTAGESAAVEPEHHRQRPLRLRGPPDIQIEAVLGERSAPRRRRAELLHAAGTPGVGPAYALPGLHRLGRAPAELARRRRRERHTLVDDDVALADPLQQAIAGADGGRGGGMRQQRYGQCSRQRAGPDHAGSRVAGASGEAPPHGWLRRSTGGSSHVGQDHVSTTRSRLATASGRR